MKEIFGFILCYLDPGNTSLIVQVIIGTVLGVGFFFKSITWRVKSFFIKLRSFFNGKNG
ncbi:MAG: hypothetical protein ACHQK8_05485 [Bacteroidia bacterium]